MKGIFTMLTKGTSHQGIQLVWNCCSKLKFLIIFGPIPSVVLFLTFFILYLILCSIDNGWFESEKKDFCC